MLSRIADYARITRTNSVLKLLAATLLLVQMQATIGCATIPDATDSDRPATVLPPATLTLGQARVYIAATGEKLEVVHDPRAGIAIVKQPNGITVILPAAIAGSEDLYRNEQITLREFDGAAALIVDGKPVFNGRIRSEK